MSKYTDFINLYEHMINRVERNYRLFHGPAWEAHLETLQLDDLPTLLGQRELIEEQQHIFYDVPEEFARLEDLHEFVTRQIAYLQQKASKQK